MVAVYGGDVRSHLHLVSLGSWSSGDADFFLTAELVSYYTVVLVHVFAFAVLYGSHFPNYVHDKP